MRSKIIFLILFMLTFTIFHDTFISLIEKKEHTSIVHHINDESPSSECAEFNKIHSMFHFMAIVTTYQSTQLELEPKENIPHLLSNYTPPLTKTFHKPPIS